MPLDAQHDTDPLDALPHLNHRTLAIILVAVGTVGTTCAVSAPTVVTSRLVLFPALVLAGILYLVRLRRSPR